MGTLHSGDADASPLPATLSQRQLYPTNNLVRKSETVKVTIVTDTELLAVLDVHCCVEREHDTKGGPRIARRDADDLRAVAAAAGF